jgi:hypothetical protein
MSRYEEKMNEPAILLIRREKKKTEGTSTDRLTAIVVVNWYFVIQINCKPHNVYLAILKQMKN